MRAKTEIPTKGLEVWACEWEDAHYDSNEYGPDDIMHRAVNYISVGILLKDDATGFTTATDVSENGTFRGINFVPAKMIVRKWRVGPLKQKKARVPSQEPQPSEIV
jgi:hypothetical protein